METTVKATECGAGCGAWQHEAEQHAATYGQHNRRADGHCATCHDLWLTRTRRAWADAGRAVAALATIDRDDPRRDYNAELGAALDDRRACQRRAIDAGWDLDDRAIADGTLVRTQDGRYIPLEREQA